MKCRYSESDIALYIEGDIHTSRAYEIEAHLVACSTCRELAGELRESQSMLKTLRQDTVSADALSHVRDRVLSEIACPNVRPAWGRWAPGWHRGGGPVCAARAVLMPG